MAKPVLELRRDVAGANAEAVRIITTGACLDVLRRMAAGASGDEWREAARLFVTEIDQPEGET
jgi:hypothetical protein